MSKVYSSEGKFTFTSHTPGSTFYVCTPTPPSGSQEPNSGFTLTFQWANTPSTTRTWQRTKNCQNFNSGSGNSWTKSSRSPRNRTIRGTVRNGSVKQVRVPTAEFCGGHWDKPASWL